MPIPKPSETKQPILNHLTKAGRPVRKAAISEAIGKHFNLTKKEMEETSLKGSKRFAMSINASIKEMKAAGLIRSHSRGFLEITPKGRGGLAGSTTRAGKATDGTQQRNKQRVENKTLPTPGETKMPILKHLAQSTGPVKIAHITESMGRHFKLTAKELAEEMPKGGKKFTTKVGVAIDEMRAKGFVRSVSRGFVEITPRGREGLQAGTITSRRRLGRPPMAQVKAPTNGRRKPGRPPKVQVKAQVKAPTNGRRKPGRPKAQPPMQYSASRQPSASPAKRDDKMVKMATDIVVSYVGKNTVPANQMPELIKSTYAALARLGT